MGRYPIRNRAPLRGNLHAPLHNAQQIVRQGYNAAACSAAERRSGGFSARVPP
jgi:hypothetical protein